MLKIYKRLTKHSESLLSTLLRRRVERGKENPARLEERMGRTAMTRPSGALIWLHAASVGEAQSSLALISEILKRTPQVHILVTTGTVTSAQLMAKSLPKGVIHQFYPLDHPDWVRRFLDHWRPDLALWIESELWPNMLLSLKEREIKTFLVNARLSERSFKRWKLFKRSIKRILDVFDGILAQTERDSSRFTALGAQNVHITDNLKYSAKALPADEGDLTLLQAHIQSRPLWLYASTHAGEEALACRVHQTLKNAHPDLLTIVVPRHPERGEAIQALCEGYGLSTVLRGDDKIPPEHDTDIYIANTLGELGLFYRLSPLACIGRSLSDDGGGGHNPIEAAQLNCAVLHGPNVQYQKDIFNDMNAQQAAIEVKGEVDLTSALQDLLTDTPKRIEYQKRAADFARHKENVLERVMKILTPHLSDLANIPPQAERTEEQHDL